MIGHACRFYGWTPEYALTMPASQFFAMLEAARSLRNQEYIRLCYISRSAQVDDNGFKEIVSWFDDLDAPERTQPQKPHLSIEEGKQALFAAIGNDPRSAARRMSTN